MGQSLRRKLQQCLQGPEDDSLHDLSSVETICTKADNSTSACLDGIGAVEDTLPGLIEKIRNIEEKKERGDEEEEGGSGNIVEHILKELKGINKIQEEISDLRQYLTSVRGSVDEVSCCVDAVLSEIGELYSGASAAPHPTRAAETSRIRRGSLGRQNAITSLQGSDTDPLLHRSKCGDDSKRLPSHRSPKDWHNDTVNPQLEHQTDNENSKHDSNMSMLGPSKPEPSYLDRGHDYQSTSSLSSCHSSNFPGASLRSGDTEYEGWPSDDMQHSVSGEGAWSEEDICSCGNSGEELENGVSVWRGCTTEGTKSITPGHSSHNSSEHFALLFGHQHNSPSNSSSRLDWIRLPTEQENLECDCSANCPYSRSSGYHTMDACANKLGSEPSGSPSRSTVLLTDCDDAYLQSHSLCDDCASSGDTLDLGSADSLDKEWTDHTISRDEAGDSLSQESSEIDPDSEARTPNVGVNVTTFSKAVFTFQSALKGALKKLEGSSPEGVKDDSGSEAPESPVRDASDLKEEQRRTDLTEAAVSLTENPTQLGPPKKQGKASAQVDCGDTHERSSSLQASPREAINSPCTPTECHSGDISRDNREYPTDGEPFKLALTPDSCPPRQDECSLGSGVSTDEVQLSPIGETHVLDSENQGTSTDAIHRERMANFQRILREKRQTRNRLSKSTPGSQGSKGSQVSQGSQGSQYQDEFTPGIFYTSIVDKLSNNSKNIHLKAFKDPMNCDIIIIMCRL